MKISNITLLSTLVFTLGFPVKSFANDKDYRNSLQISKLGDVDKTCHALSREAVAMRNIIRDKVSIQDDAEMKGHGITAAGAIGSFLIGSVTGGIGLAAAGFLATEAVENEAEEAEDIKDVAAQRRSLMMGIYNAKGCAGPIEHAMLDTPTIEPEQRFAAVEPHKIEPAAGISTGEFVFPEGFVRDTPLNSRYND